MSDQGLHSARSEAEAADWFARLKRRDIDRSVLRAFWAWKAEPANGAAYARVEAAWIQAHGLALDPDLAAARRKAVARTAPPKPKLTWSPIPSGRLGAGLAVLVVAIASVALIARLAAAPSYATRIGQQRLVTLQDGSRVRLNTDSLIRVRFSRTTREVELARGEAFFEAAHDARRPFVVEAADASVTAVGTKFDVRRRPDGVWVALVEGRVHVDQDHRAQSVVLAPNQQLTVTRAGISRPTAADAAGSTSWTAGLLTFHDVALREAVAEVNRYTDRKVELDAPLGDSHISGVFNVGDTGAFVTALEKYYGLQAETAASGAIRLTARRAQPTE